MALKPDRQYESVDISYFMNETAERGGIVCAATGITPGSGAAMDNANQVVQYRGDTAAQLSGVRPIGLLLNDVVNIDLSRQILNHYKSEAQINDKVAIMRRGWVVTDMIQTNAASGSTFPLPAYLTGDGKLASAAGYAASGYPLVGSFMSAADSDGYAKVWINLT